MSIAAIILLAVAAVMTALVAFDVVPVKPGLCTAVALVIMTLLIPLVA